MRQLNRLLIIAPAILTLLIACQLGITSPKAAPSGTEQAVSTPPTEVTATSEAPASTQSELAGKLGLQSIQMLTPTSGNGDRPTFEWQAVPGASMYSVTLNAPSGESYWGWAGTDTKIPLGGLPKLLEASPGPRVIDGMSWTVTALNDNFEPIAFGGPRPIAP